MPKKTKKRIQRKSVIEKEIEREVEKIEGWVTERKRFLIKLAWVVGLITALLIISQLYLRVRGVGF